MLKTILFKSKGQAALIVVFVIMSVLAVLITSLGFITYIALKAAGNTLSSSQSYYLAEAGVEDALLRVTNRMSYTSSYTLTIGSDSTQVNISGPLTSLVITSRAGVNNRVRKVEVDMGSNQSSSNVSFNYGVQVGYGGLVMSNNAGINGNVYSNGPISGANGAFVTGTAIAATGTASTADQTNESPMPPTSSITFGNSSSTQAAAQSFQVSTTNTLNRLRLYLKKSGSPADISVSIVNDNVGKPGTTTFATGTIPATSVGTNYGWVDVANWSANPQLNAGVTYWFVLNASSNSSKYYIWGANNTYIGGIAETGIYSAGPWTNTNLDGYFEIYLGGSVGSINSVTVGQSGSGDAWARSVTNSTVAGTKYCQTTNNSPACNTSKPDPTTQTFPISDSNINDWKAQAAAGTVISGNYTLINNASGALGPAKITGNLSLSDGATLNVTGTLWIQGTISLNNNVHINLDPAYGSSGGVIIADGWVSIGNNSIFNGSGQAGSYILLITTNDCNGVGSPTGGTCSPTNSAMEVTNNAGTVILFTENGQMHLSNNAGAKEATGYKLLLDNNATITYQTGLANANFSSGPGAGFSINAWKEVT